MQDAKSIAGLPPLQENNRNSISFLGISLLAALFSFLPPAEAQTQVSVTNLTSFHYGGESETGQDGSAKGWPNIRYPSSPPIQATHPYSGRAYLFGGSAGSNYNFIQSVGLWWMPASPGHYERLQTSSNMVYGTVLGPPVQSSSGHIYAAIVSPLVYSTNASVKMFSTDGIDCKGENMAACLAMSSYFTTNHSGLVGRGLIFRTEFDGSNLEIVESTIGELNIPNGALVIDSNDNIYGLDQGGESQSARLFKIDSEGAFHTVYEFGSTPAGKAQKPNGLILGSDGWLYGVNAYPRGIPGTEGIATALDTPVGALYKIDPSAAAPANTYQVLHTFTLSEGEIFSHIVSTDSPFDQPGLNYIVEAKDGYLYGTTSLPTCFYWGRTYWPREDIDRWSNLSTPLCGDTTVNEFQLEDDFSSLYDGPMPHGSVYRINKDGSSGLEILHRFSYTDGSQPRGPLALGKDGAIYGTTVTGGANRQWEYTTLAWSGSSYGRLSKEKPARRNCEYFKSFGSIYPKCMDYENAGELYRQLYEQSYAYNGTLYRIIPGQIQLGTDGSVAQDGFELVHSFEYDVDGRRPIGVTAGEDGRLYGATLSGGQGYDTSGGITWYSDDKGTAFMVDLDGDTPDASITLTFTPNEIDLGQNTTVTWTSYQTRDCVASWRTDANGNWQSVETSDSEELSPASGTYYHTLQCVDSVKGTEISATATLYVNAPITAHNDEHTDYGNGGGSGSLPPALPLLLLPAWLLRRYRRR